MFTLEQFLTFLLKVIEGIFTALWEIGKFIFGLFKKPDPPSLLNDRYEASFDSVSYMMDADGAGICLDGKHVVGIDDGALTGTLVVGASGTGKSTVVTIPTCYRLLGKSVIIHDPSGELAQATMGFFASHNYRIKVIHYSKPEISDGFNIISWIKSASESYKVASMLVINSTSKSEGSDFWNTQATALIALIINCVLKLDKKYQNIANVKYILDCFVGNSDLVDMVVAKTNDPTLVREYKNFIGADPKLLSNIISTARAALQIFSQPSIQKITSFDSIDFEEFRKEKCVLYIQNRTLDLPYYSVLTSIFFERFFSSIMEELPDRNDKEIFFLIDEFSSLRIDTIQLALSNLRKYRASCVLIVQAEEQIQHVYGSQASTAIVANCNNKVYFPNASLDTCKKLSDMLGKREVSITDKESGVVTERFVRPLMTPDEIRKLAYNHALIFSGTKAVFTEVFPYYDQRKLRIYSEIPAPPLVSKVPFDEVPLIKF